MFFKILSSYIKDRLRILALHVIFTAIFLIVFLMFKLSIDAFITAFALTLLVEIFFASADFMHYMSIYKAVNEAKSNENLRPSIQLQASSELEELTQSLIAMQALKIKELENINKDISNKHKEHFARWSHQIKTPIFALNLLLDKENSSNKYLMKSKLIEIENYTNTALSFVRLESDTNDISIERFSVNSILRDVVRKFKLFFIEKNLYLDISDDDIVVLSDKKWLGFIVEQVLLNSIKYTEKGGINIRINENEKEIIISDTGIGILAEDIDRIFEEGYTGYNGREHKKSSGIGLSLVKKACDMLMIDVSATSKIGEGTSIRLKF